MDRSIIRIRSIPLSDAEWQALLNMSNEQYRDLTNQAHWIIRSELIRQGFLSPDDEVIERTNRVP
jgi:hypothetical protein